MRVLSVDSSAASVVPRLPDESEWSHLVEESLIMPWNQCFLWSNYSVVENVGSSCTDGHCETTEVRDFSHHDLESAHIAHLHPLFHLTHAIKMLLSFFKQLCSKLLLNLSRNMLGQVKCRGSSMIIHRLQELRCQLVLRVRVTWVSSMCHATVPPVN